MSNTRSNRDSRNGAARGGNSGGKSSNNSNNGGRQQEKGRSRRRKSSRKKKIDHKAFWGDAEQLTEVGATSATITAKPSAVVQSLGRPPLSNQANAAEHYFAAVYDRAVNLAAALAAAGDLITPDDLSSDEPPSADR